MHQNADWNNHSIVVIVRDRTTGNDVPPTVNGGPTQVTAGGTAAVFDATSTAYVVSVPPSVAAGSRLNCRSWPTGTFRPTPRSP